MGKFHETVVLENNQIEKICKGKSHEESNRQEYFLKIGMTIYSWQEKK